MSYKEQYLALKKKIMSEQQYGSGRLNPLFVDELSNLAFVIGDQVLGDDVHAVILSLIEEFNRVAANDLKHNLELSQYYAVGKGLMNRGGVVQCDNCELVLKYTDISICLINGRVRQHVIKKDREYYGNSEINNERTEIDCDISRGLVRFYIKQRIGDSFKYNKIHVVKLNMSGTLEPFMNALYQNNEEIAKLDEAISIALSKGQSDAILSSANSGRLEVMSPQDIKTSTTSVNTLISQAKKASINSQLDKMSNQRIMASFPTQPAVNSANTVANIIMNNKSANNMSVILVPGNEPIPIKADPNVESAIGVMKGSGITITNLNSASSRNTLNSAANNRASIAVDANLAVVPTNQVVSNPNIKISRSKESDSASIGNKLMVYLNSVKNQTEDVVSNLTKDAQNIYGNLSNQTQDFTNKAVDFFTGKPTVTPISTNLSVMSNSPNYIPLPLSSHQASLKETSIENLTRSIPASQKTVLKRFNNKITAANRDALIPIDQRSQIAAIAKNGDFYTKKIKEGIDKKTQEGIDMGSLSLDQLMKKYSRNPESEKALIKSILDSPTSPGPMRSNLASEKVTENIILSESSNFSLPLSNNNKKNIKFGNIY